MVPAGRLGKRPAWGRNRPGKMRRGLYTVSQAIQPTCEVIEDPERRHPVAMAGAIKAPGPLAPGRPGVLGWLVAAGLIALVAAAVADALFDAASAGTARQGALIAAVLLGCAAVIALLRHHHARATAAIEVLWRDAATALEDQRTLLKRITDAQPAGIYIADAEGHCRFANITAARRIGREPAEMLGQPLDALWDPEHAACVSAANRTALESGVPQQQWITTAYDAVERVLLTDHVPLAPGAGLPAAVLVIERDVTDRVAERERHAHMRERLVEVLIETVDQRDPYAAHHATQAGQLADRIAKEMNLDETTRDTARTAGSLLTIGKSLVPEVMLTHQVGLSPRECRQAHASLEASIGLLRNMEFDGPVADTLRQLQEREDGRGMPLGLPGPELLPSARVLKVANSFLGLISRRPGCPGLTVDEALIQLKQQAGVHYDGEVVTALKRHLDNGGRSAWRPAAPPEIRKPPPH